MVDFLVAQSLACSFDSHPFSLLMFVSRCTPSRPSKLHVKDNFQDEMDLLDSLVSKNQNYNPEGKRGNISREKAMAELLQVVKSTKPDKSSPKIVEKTADYVRVEYESPILGLVDDVEFWFPPGKKTIVQYRAASRLGNYDFDANRKRIKALRMQLEKKGWASEDTV
ncbi:hypothetical protein T459_01461 [Capsicum annuum]|uniref:DUF1499 domain-containing protein n=1 Tax=Capsicum annuum TaxID=4072 RepID=A0A2G3AH62_CAPAN|nr:hypothetical protein T459_01461 [Capsicum annuum]